jgi:hypothetical protein
MSCDTYALQATTPEGVDKATFACDLCEHRAADVYFAPSGIALPENWFYGDPGNEQQVAEDRILVDFFGRTRILWGNRLRPSGKASMRAREAIRAQDAEALFLASRHMIWIEKSAKGPLRWPGAWTPFWCAGCRRIICRDHWDYPPGIYGNATGRQFCPEGHEAEIALHTD